MSPHTPDVSAPLAALVGHGGRGCRFGVDLAIEYIRVAERCCRVPAAQRLPRQEREIDTGLCEVA